MIDYNKISKSLSFLWLIGWLVYLSLTGCLSQTQVSIRKEGKKQMSLGEVINYKLTVRNFGDDVMQDVTLVEHIPEGFQFDSDKISPLTKKWEIGNLQPKEEKIITYSLKGVLAGKFITTSEVYTGTNKACIENYSLEVVPFNLRLFQPENKNVICWKTSTYTIKIENHGNESALGVILTNTLLPQVDFISSSPKGTLKRNKEDGIGDSIVWKLDLTAHTTVNIDVDVMGKVGGNGVNTLKLSFSRFPQIAPVISEATWTVTEFSGQYGVLIHVYDTVDPCEMGEQTAYVIEIQKKQGIQCTNVILIDRLPKEMDFVKAEGPTKSRWEEKEHAVVFEAIPMLEAKDRLTYTIYCCASQTGIFKNFVVLKSDQIKELSVEEKTSIYRNE